MGGGGAAGQNERVTLAAVGRAKRDPSEIEHGEAVRVRELELQREADDVELRQRARALERDQRQVSAPQLRFHVDPRRVATLGERARIVVQDLVEDLVAEMAHPDVVDIGKGQADPCGHPTPVLAHLARLAAGVARWLFDFVEEGSVGVLFEAVHRAGPSTACPGGRNQSGRTAAMVGAASALPRRTVGPRAEPLRPMCAGIRAGRACAGGGVPRLARTSAREPSARTPER